MERIIIRTKQIFLTVCILVITLEVSPYIISPLISSQSFSRQAIKENLMQESPLSFLKEEPDEIIGNTDKEYLGRDILHPYIGFVGHPSSLRNEFGFTGINPILKRSPDVVNICLTGGSVALGLYHRCGDRMISSLGQVDYFKDKKINVVQLALPGFKQPQQLMSLSYFIALGAEYDLIINIDGFNEMALPFSDNLPFNVFPSFPRHWNMFSRKRINTKVQHLLGMQTVGRFDRRNNRQFFSKSILRYSNFGLLIWRIKDNDISLTLNSLEGKLRNAIKNADKDYQSTGPQIAMVDTTEYFRELAILWRNSSIEMNALKSAGAFKYFHFLQPNQYFDGSKVLTNTELSRAYEQGPLDYKTAIQKGYPIITEIGKDLLERGVSFTDLTMMFKKEQRSVYQDKCCHFNQLGNELIADRITDEIIKHFRKEEEHKDR